jgi:hypothetical protein
MNLDVFRRDSSGRHLPMATTTRNGNGAVDERLAECAACRRTVRLDDDFVRLRESIYHLNCMLTALRDLGHDAAGGSTHAAALSNGIATLRR